MSKELAVKNETAVAPGDLLTAIARAASDPTVDVVKMQALYAMHKDMLAEQRRMDFDAALAEVQRQLPQFIKSSKAKNSMYAALEDIDKITKPLLTTAGFSQTCSEESSTETTATFVFTLSRDGHEKSVRKTFSIDRAYKNSQGAAIRPAIQDDGSTISYATRYLLKMILGIVEKDGDTDGEKLEKITNEQALDLKLQVEQSGMNADKFLVYMKVGAFADIMASDWEKGQTVIRAAIAEKKK